MIKRRYKKRIKKLRKELNLENAESKLVRCLSCRTIYPVLDVYDVDGFRPASCMSCNSTEREDYVRLYKRVLAKTEAAACFCALHTANGVGLFFLAGERCVVAVWKAITSPIRLLALPWSFDRFVNKLDDIEEKRNVALNNLIEQQMRPVHEGVKNINQNINNVVVEKQKQIEGPKHKLIRITMQGQVYYCGSQSRYNQESARSDKPLREEVFSDYENVIDGCKEYNLFTQRKTGTRFYGRGQLAGPAEEAYIDKIQIDAIGIEDAYLYAVEVVAAGKYVIEGSMKDFAEGREFSTPIWVPEHGGFQVKIRKLQIPF
jgi:hypothetical protein